MQKMFLAGSLALIALLVFLWLRERRRVKNLQAERAELLRKLSDMEALPQRLAVSRAVIRGKLLEALAPILPDFPFPYPERIVYIGGTFPVDYLIWDGERIIFLEVKSGSSELNVNERRLRDAIRRGAVEWVEYRPALGQRNPGEPTIEIVT